jgi:hypothetical protein
MVPLISKGELCPLTMAGKLQKSKSYQIEVGSRYITAVPAAA